MQFSLEQTIKSCPHYDEKTWGLALEDRKLAVEYEIQGQIDSIRTEYNMYLAKFTSMIHQVPHPPPSHSPPPSLSENRDEHLIATCPIYRDD